ncbi:MAG: hypothetical protein ACT4N2_13300 [Hyphomicrobium sp.]
MRDTDREEIELLLPWYATGKLDAKDKAAVESYLAAHPDMRRVVDLAGEEADATFAANEAIAPPGRAALEHLMATIEAEPRQIAKRAASGLWERCVEWVDGFTPRTRALAGIAAALVVTVQAATLGSLLVERSGDGFQTASGPVEAITKGTFALVAFQPGASVEAVTAHLTEAGAVIVEGPKAGGIYRVRVSAEVLDQAAAAARVEKLKSDGRIIAFAAPTP